MSYLKLSLCFLIFIFPSYSSKSQVKDDNEGKKIFFQNFSKKINDTIPTLGSFIVSKNGNVIYENYFHGANKETVFNIKSVTKSVTSVLAGIAFDKNELPNLDTPVLKILPEYNISRNKFYSVSDLEGKTIMDSIRNALTLKHILTMRSGFDWVENSPVSRAMGMSSDPVRFTLELPFEEYPGDKFNYNSGETYVFGAVLSKLVKSNLKDFANKNLFQFLNIKVEKWSTDPQNRNLAGSEMYLKALEMLKFGELVLNNGKVGNKQIVSEQWIKESTSEQVKLDFWDVMPNANGYGYYWWRRKTNGHQAFVASGYGGQLICIVPDLKMVVVTTCFLNEKNRGRQEIKRLHSFIDEITKNYENESK